MIQARTNLVLESRSLAHLGISIQPLRRKLLNLPGKPE